MKAEHRPGVEASPSAHEEPTSRLLLRLASGDGERITVDDVVVQAGDRAYGLAIVLFALPEALPLPVAGMSAFIGLPLALVCLYMIVFGSEQRFPGWLRRRSIRRGLVRQAVVRLGRYLERAERLSRPRWIALAGANRLLGVVLLILAVVIALPIPFGNLPPAICVVAIGFGMLQRDGVVVAAALTASAVTVTGMTIAILFAGRYVLDWSSGLFGAGG